MRSLSCDFWPSRALRRSSNSLRSLSMAAATSGSFARASRVVGKATSLGSVALAREPGLACGHLVEALGDDGEIDSRDGLVKPQHDLAAANALAVAHQQLADDAASQVLHLLDVGVDHDRSRRDHRAGQFGGRGPAADPDGQQQGDDDATQEVTANGDAFVASDVLFHRVHPLVCGTTLSGAGGWIRAGSTWPGSHPSARRPAVFLAPLPARGPPPPARSVDARR